MRVIVAEDGETADGLVGVLARTPAVFEHPPGQFLIPGHLCFEMGKARVAGAFGDHVKQLVHTQQPGTAIRRQLLQLLLQGGPPFAEIDLFQHVRPE
jgi:hypothetical protein